MFTFKENIIKKDNIKEKKYFYFSNSDYYFKIIKIKYLFRILGQYIIIIKKWNIVILTFCNEKEWSEKLFNENIVKKYLKRC